MQQSLLQNLYGQEYLTAFGDASLVWNTVAGALEPMGSEEGSKAHDYLAGYQGQLPVELTYQFLGASGLDAITGIHAVLFHHVDPSTGNVYFENPWGDRTSDSKAGHVDPSQPGFFYLTKEEFVSHVVWVVAPTGDVYPPVVNVPNGTTSTTTTAAPHNTQETPNTPTRPAQPEGPPTGTTVPTPTAEG